MQAGISFQIRFKKHRSISSSLTLAPRNSHNESILGVPMLFLLNTRVLEIDAPEARLARRWKTLGCGDPRSMMARDALDFVKAVIESHRANKTDLEDELAADIGALIISKTGANAALFVDSGEPRLTLLPEGILASLADKLDEGSEVEVAEIWPKAA